MGLLHCYGQNPSNLLNVSACYLLKNTCIEVELLQLFAFELWDMFPFWEILQLNRCLPDGSLIQLYTEVRSATSEIKFNSQEILIVDSACSNMTFVSIEGKRREKVYILRIKNFW